MTRYFVEIPDYAPLTEGITIEADFQSKVTGWRDAFRTVLDGI